MSDCIFCKIIDKKLPSKLLGESDVSIAIADINPDAPFHALVIPKKHVASLNDLTIEDRINILPDMYNLADKLAQDNNFKKNGYRCVINNQKQGGQVVFHLHMHVLAGAQMKGKFGA